MQREKLRRGLREITAKSTEKKEDRGREVGRVRSSQDLYVFLPFVAKLSLFEVDGKTEERLSEGGVVTELRVGEEKQLSVRKPRLYSLLK